MMRFQRFLGGCTEEQARAVLRADQVRAAHLRQKVQAIMLVALSLLCFLVGLAGIARLLPDWVAAPALIAFMVCVAAINCRIPTGKALVALLLVSLVALPCFAIAADPCCTLETCGKASGNSCDCPAGCCKPQPAAPRHGFKHARPRVLKRLFLARRR